MADTVIYCNHFGCLFDILGIGEPLIFIFIWLLTIYNSGWVQVATILIFFYVGEYQYLFILWILGHWGHYGNDQVKYLVILAAGFIVLIAIDESCYICLELDP